MTRALVTSEKAAMRLDRAREVLADQHSTRPLTVVGATSECASELVRSLRRPIFGWRRLTLFRFAAELARPALLAQGLSLASPLTLEAVWARVVHELAQVGKLGRFAPLGDRPGLARALSATVTELRTLQVDFSGLEPALQVAVESWKALCAEHRLVDRATVFELAARAEPPTEPLFFLDVPVRDGVEAKFVAAVVARAPLVFATAPSSDAAGVKRLAHALQVQPEHLVDDAPTALHALQRNLFNEARASESGHVFSDVFSAPGEAREAVEIARRVLELAKTGVAFDRVAVLLRSPMTYRAALEDAFKRAEIPAWFSSGVPKPDPSGRALLALLFCAEEGLSARRFAEYLSLGQVPTPDADGAPPAEVPASQRFARGEGEALLPGDDKAPPEVVPDDVQLDTDPDAPVRAGTLRSPRKWEAHIIDAAVIGGVDRWRRRLEGLERQKQTALASPTTDEQRRTRVQQELDELGALKDFALPILDELSRFPAQASWGEWLQKLGALVTRALRFPRRVLGVLQDLAPMAPVGPVGLAEVRAVLAERLAEVTENPPVRRYGSVFIASVEEVRGLAFDHVFVPGLAERIFPQKVREDPLLPDAARVKLDGRLETNEERVLRERVALQLAVGAARQQATLSWPRIDAEHARPRVPSFYALEAARAIEGALPEYENLQRRAEQNGQARLAWPAPRVPTLAIDDAEFDLSVLEGILQGDGPQKGRARYLVDANTNLARSLRQRFLRWSRSSWTGADGLVNPNARARVVMEGQRFTARAFSPTALEQFSACPYKFYLSAVLRLSPLEIPGEIEELGPLEKGSMTHSVQFNLLSRLRDEGVVVRADVLETVVFPRLDQVIAEVTAKFRDDFVPAIDRVWNDGVETMRADLREWLRKVAADEVFVPWRFELGFGLISRDEADPASTPDPVSLEHGLKLRGSIDLVEKSVDGFRLRATDYKTGKAWAEQGNIVGGGGHLQPVLYSMVLEKLFPELKVDSGRLFYCTQVGGFSEVTTTYNLEARAAAGQVLKVVRDALETAFLPAFPDDGECRWCDFRSVCGPDEERRVKKTNKALKADVTDLRNVRRMK